MNAIKVATKSLIIVIQVIIIGFLIGYVYSIEAKIKDKFERPNLEELQEEVQNLKSIIKRIVE